MCRVDASGILNYKCRREELGWWLGCHEEAALILKFQGARLGGAKIRWSLSLSLSLFKKNKKRRRRFAKAWRTSLATESTPAVAASTRARSASARCVRMGPCSRSRISSATSRATAGYAALRGCVASQSWSPNVGVSRTTHVVSNDTAPRRGRRKIECDVRVRERGKNKKRSSAL